MQARRPFLRSVAGAAIAGTVRGAHASTPTPTRAVRIRAVAFDLFTIFDPRSVVATAETIVPGRGRALCESWRVRQFEYSWLRVAAGTYRDFRFVTADALAHAARASGVDLSEDASEALMTSFERLAPWADSRSALTSMRDAGLRLAPLANFTTPMIENLLGRAGMRTLFDDVISTDRAKTYKPDPRAYALGPTTFKLSRAEIAFVAFGGWDAAGAKWFGFPTFWVNRLGVPAEELPPGPDAVGSTLTEAAAWVSAR